MCVIMASVLFAYAYVVPFIISGGANDAIEQSSDVLIDGINIVDEVMDGALSSTTEQIQGSSTLSNLEHKTGIVSRVTDGDTLVVNNTPIRLAMIDTPERGEPGYQDATEFTYNNCPLGSTVSYKPDSGQSSGSYGRTIAKVWCGNTASPSLNELLLENGHAELLTRFCNASEFSDESWTACREP